jgi:hypothetical protein
MIFGLNRNPVRPGRRFLNGEEAFDQRPKRVGEERAAACVRNLSGGQRSIELMLAALYGFPRSLR